jgi:replication factor C small subunit
LFERARFILAEQDIAYERAVIAELVNKHFPDNRKLINELQRYSVAGTIDAGVLVNISDENLKSLTGHLKGKEFGEMRKWVVNNLDNDPVKIFRKIYDSLYTTLEPATIPHAVLIIADYQYKSAFVADQEINLVACLTELMSQVKFK